MKKYARPDVKICSLTTLTDIANFDMWLQENGFSDAGITTYSIGSAGQTRAE